MPAKVAHIEYDPNRTARIALLHYVDGTKRYIIAPNHLSQGDIVEAGPNADIKPGNNLPLRNIPVGSVIHAVELRPGGGAKMARSAGASIQLVLARASSPSCACLRVKSATSMCAAAPPSAKWATPSRSTSTGARPAVCAGRASARPCVVWP